MFEGFHSLDVGGYHGLGVRIQESGFRKGWNYLHLHPLVNDISVVRKDLFGF